MTRLVRASALLVCLAAVPVRAQTDAQPDFTAVTALLHDSLPPLGGGEFLLLQRGHVLYRESFGAWDSTAAVPIASASKWLSGTLLMSLVADGTLSLNDTVGQWLPDALPDKRGITLRQLFSHTSGLPGLEADGCLSEPTTTLGACTRLILDGPLRNPPGNAFRYGGLSMQVAGRIAEVAAGQPFNTLFAARVAAPLGLTQTDFGPGDNPHVGGGATSTAAEYARILQMLLDGGGEVLPPDAVEAMLADQTRGATIVYTPYQALAVLVGDPSLAEIRYGIGVWREVVDSETGAGVEWASQGALGFSPWIDRARGVVAVLAVEDQLRDIYPTYRQLKTLVRDALDTATAVAEAPAGETGLALWPNPARDRMTVGTGGSPGTVRLVDVLGREVARREIGGGGPVRFDLRGLAPGVYAVHLDQDRRQDVRRVVVVR